MSSLEDLARRLERLDGAGYRAYGEVRGRWEGRDLTLAVDHVQGDPFATPSRVRLVLPRAFHGLPPELDDGGPRRTGLEDFLLRRFRAACGSVPRAGGSGASGRVEVTVGSPTILRRSGAALADGVLELRFRVGLPARGRRVMGRAAAALLTRELPRAAKVLRWEALERERAREHAQLSEEHAALQAQLEARGLVAFVRDGAILPRASGVSQEPLADAVPFAAPPTLQVTLPTLHHGEVTGLGLPPGVTLLTGGGYHGKTTLLEAIQRGVHPHVPGDGREWVATRPDAVKVRSADGRAVTGVDLRPFVAELPGGRSTAHFQTADASGSTSLAAAILEALEVGTSLLLLDEDTSATNLLVRDARMQALVRHETITPLIDRVRELAEHVGCSTILVSGGSGDYLDVADTVLALEEYRCVDATGRAREVAARLPTERATGAPAEPLYVARRRIRPDCFDPRGHGGRPRVKARGTRAIEFGAETIDLDDLEQLVEDGQARAIGALLRTLGERGGEPAELVTLARETLAEARRRGLSAVDPSPELAEPRLYELVAAASRYRALRVVEERAGG